MLFNVLDVVDAQKRKRGAPNPEAGRLHPLLLFDLQLSVRFPNDR